MALYQFEGRKPQVPKGAFVAESALVVGDVQVGKDAYIGHGVILRGDYGTIIIGEGAAVETVTAADVVTPNILAALDLLLQPLRLVATLRS